MTEVFLFGTFHFLEQKWDIGSESLQREISELVGKLGAFRPEAVAVEGPVHQQAVIDAAYRRVSLSDFEDADLMRTGNLGESQPLAKIIRSHGTTKPYRSDSGWQSS